MAGSGDGGGSGYLWWCFLTGHFDILRLITRGFRRRRRTGLRWLANQFTPRCQTAVWSVSSGGKLPWVNDRRQRRSVLTNDTRPGSLPQCQAVSAISTLIAKWQHRCPQISCLTRSGDFDRNTIRGPR